MNLITQNSYSGAPKKDPYTGARYDFTDFEEESPHKISSKMAPSAKLPNVAASPPTINAIETRDIITKITQNHNKVLQLFKNRKTQLWNLQQYWTSGNSIKTLKYLQQWGDTSLIKDFLQYTFAKNEGIEFVTMEGAIFALKLIQMLAAKAHTEFQEWAKKAYENMFNHLKPVS